MNAPLYLISFLKDSHAAWRSSQGFNRSVAENPSSGLSAIWEYTAQKKHAPRFCVLRGLDLGYEKFSSQKMQLKTS